MTAVYTVERMVRTEEDVKYVIAPPGLLLSLGDGRAVEVTAEMLARATDSGGFWEHVSQAARKDAVERAQKWIDRLIQQAQEADRGR